MKKHIPRILSLLLVLVLTANLITPGFAERIWIDGTDFETGDIPYAYDQIPEYMMDNSILRALEYFGYDTQTDFCKTSQKGLCKLRQIVYNKGNNWHRRS